MNKSGLAVGLLLLMSALPACSKRTEPAVDVAPPWLSSLQVGADLSGCLVRASTRDGPPGIGTAFCIDEVKGRFLSARHVLWPTEDAVYLDARPYQPTHIEYGNDDSWKEDWVFFETGVRRDIELVYDPYRPLNKGQEVFIAGFAHLGLLPRNSTFEQLMALPITVIQTQVAYKRLKRRLDDQDYLLLKNPSSRDFGGLSGSPAIIWDQENNQWVAIGIVISRITSTRNREYLLVLRHKLESL